MMAMTPIMMLPPPPHQPNGEAQPNVANPENLANVANPENLANVANGESQPNVANGEAQPNGANPENLANVARGLGKCEQSLAENHEEASDEGGGAIEWISLD